MALVATVTVMIATAVTASVAVAVAAAMATTGPRVALLLTVLDTVRSLLGLLPHATTTIVAVTIKTPSLGSFANSTY